MTTKTSKALPDSRILSLAAHAGEIFEDRQKALFWLQTPHPSLAGQTPLHAASIAEGFQEAEDVLGRIEYGVIG